MRIITGAIFMKFTVLGNLGALITKMPFLSVPHVSMATILSIRIAIFQQIMLNGHGFSKLHTK